VTPRPALARPADTSLIGRFAGMPDCPLRTGTWGTPPTGWAISSITSMAAMRRDPTHLEPQRAVNAEALATPWARHGPNTHAAIGPAGYDLRPDAG